MSNNIKNYLYKLCFTMIPKNISFGGGLSFLNNLSEYLSNNGVELVYDLKDDDIDIIFMMDPRILTLNKIDLKIVKEYKKKHKNVLVIHRINDCDLPRGITGVLDPIIMDALQNVDTMPIFVSNFTKKYFEGQGYEGESHVILNGCNTGQYYPNNAYVFDSTKKIKIYTHHWSSNYNKGFEFYNALDEYISTHPQFEFIFVGREWCKDYVPTNAKIVGPYNGVELGNVLREADIYITGAQYENCPCHLVEALASGIPTLVYDKIGGGLELCKKNGEIFSDVKSMIKKLELMSKDLMKYRNKTDVAQLDSKICSRDYENVIVSTLLKNKYKVKDVKNKPLWFKKLLLWLIRIEQTGYNWSLNGFDNRKLGACSLFAKLSTIFSKYYKFNNGKMLEEINKFYANGLFVDIEKEIISESRQAVSAIINLKGTIPEMKVDDIFKEPLYFMNDTAFNNPWGALAHASHYLFFMRIQNNEHAINNVVNKIQKYKKPDGWYNLKPAKHVNINGIMKLFTGFDAVNDLNKTDSDLELHITEEFANNVADNIMEFYGSSGGCGVYDYVYVLTKCMDYIKDEDKLNKCKIRLTEVYQQILTYQMVDGGFKYDNTTIKAHKYYGELIVPDGYIGNIHSTTLFCMALSRLDKYLKLGLGLNLAIS